MEHAFDLLVGQLEQYKHFTYLVIYLILVVSGAGLPIPEEAVLLSSGYLAYKDVTHIYYTIPVCLAGMISGDLLTYFIGRRLGQGLFRNPLLRWAMTEERLEKVQRYYAKYGRKTVLFSRYVAGIRQASYFMAGAMRVPLKDFLMMEMLAAFSTGPISIYLAYRLGAYIDEVLDFFHVAKVALLVVVVLGLVAFVAWRYLRARSNAKLLALEIPPSKSGGEGKDSESVKPE
jgi:membrane protein DedA with SNARE-associated domain